MSLIKSITSQIKACLHRTKVKTIVRIALVSICVCLVVLLRHGTSHVNTSDVPVAAEKTDAVEKQIVQCMTTKGNFRIFLNEDEAPNGVRLLKKLVDAKFFDKKVAFFRNNKVMTQFGAVENELVPKFVRELDVRDVNPHGEDPAERKKHPWPRGSLAMIGGTQMLIVKKQNSVMGTNVHDAIAGYIIEEDMHVIDSLQEFNDNIDNPKGDPAPDQREIFRYGWTYLDQEFPQVDAILSCSFQV
jgi:cyclophilin family peptidyl-prolyl cis-trans isomerase